MVPGHHKNLSGDQKKKPKCLKLKYCLFSFLTVTFVASRNMKDKFPERLSALLMNYVPLLLAEDQTRNAKRCP